MASTAIAAPQIRLIKPRCGQKPRLAGEFTKFKGVVPYLSAKNLTFSIAKFIVKRAFVISYYIFLFLWQYHGGTNFAGLLVDHLLPLAVIMMLLLMNMVCRLLQLQNSCSKLVVFTSFHLDANVFYISLNFSKHVFGLAFCFLVAILVSP
ncbi:unnamed protein product [Coffea canephora]|uniref:Uncharacterized protein n=1 Tax=Coffea canephora TaxID=49390 RepID=A0A068UR41_COFCA|nr:unnamed protein product [Coffea canephora]